MQRAEWVGGRLRTPFYVTEAEPYRPEATVWLELPERIVVGFQVIDPNGPPVSFAQTLEQAMRAPIAGPPRRPARIRVPSAGLADELQAAAPDIEIVVAPTPELDELLREMAETLPDGDVDHAPSYFEHGRVSVATVKSLFTAAQGLFAVAPWQSAADSQVLRLDIPALDVEGACLSIIGALGESLGFIIFPSLVAFESFLDAMDAGGATATVADLGSDMLVLNFDRGADLPPQMRREIAEHGLPVAAANAYPSVQHHDRDGLLRPLGERDVRIVAATASALAAFFVKHGDLFRDESFEPVCESWFDDDDLEVRFTAPYEAASLFDVNDAPQPVPVEHATPKVGRNSPCPCGSGRKYKKCCLPREQAQQAAAPKPAAVHDVDQRLIERMLHFASRRTGKRWTDALEAFTDPAHDPGLYLPWSVYHVPIDGRRLPEWFVEAQGRNLSRTESLWISAQQSAWLSVWEVRAVDPGRSVTLADLLTGETRTVTEVGASKTLTRRDAILARVVDWGDTSLLCGCHSRPLPPLEAAEIVAAIRRGLSRARANPTERLRDQRTGRRMIARWEAALAALDERFAIPPHVTNTDGEKLLLTVDHFEFEPSSRAEIERRLGVLPGVRPPEPTAAEPRYVFTRPGNATQREWESTVIGDAELSTGRLRLTTNSVPRADRLRRELESACGELLRHRGREHADPLSQSARAAEGSERARPKGGGGSAARAPEGLPGAVAAELAREFKARHYATWPEQPLPALGGKTPRQALKSKAGRATLDALLKDLEQREARLPADERFDVSRLRRELGLSDGG